MLPRISSVRNFIEKCVDKEKAKACEGRHRDWHREMKGEEVPGQRSLPPHFI